MIRTIASLAIAALLAVSVPSRAAAGSTEQAGLLRTEAHSSSILGARENFHRINGPVHIIEQLSGLFFNWKPEYGGQRDLDCFVAGDLSAIPPEVLVWEVPGEIISGVRHDRLAPIFVEAIKEIEIQVEHCYRLLQSLAEQFKGLELKVSDHEVRLSTLEANICSLQTQVATHDTSLTLVMEKNELLEKQNEQFAAEIQELREMIQEIKSGAGGE